MSNLLEQLGIIGDFDWQDLAMCARVQNKDLFFDVYEVDQESAKTVDQMCLACPVTKQCGVFGIDNKATGVWGGVYLADGRQDKDRNTHKTAEVWKRLEEKYG